MPVNKNELTKEQIAKAMACETAEELMALAKSEGIELTKEEAEAYLAEMDDMELDSDALTNVVTGAVASPEQDKDVLCLNKIPVLTIDNLKKCVMR